MVVRVASVVLLAFAICTFAVSSYQASTDDQSIAVATITKVQLSGPYRRVYDVIFVTPHGLACESTVDSGRGVDRLTWQPEVGKQVQVRYPASGLPCDQVIEAEDEAPFVQYAMPFAFLVVGLIAAYLACRTRPTGARQSRADRWARALP
jgi:hypothetical protein